MKTGFLIILTALFQVACTHNEVRHQGHWVIEEADPDIKMEIDEMFLKKSQKLSREEMVRLQRRKAFMNP